MSKETWKYSEGPYFSVLTEDGYVIVDEIHTLGQAKCLVAAHNAAVRRLEHVAANMDQAAHGGVTDEGLRLLAERQSAALEELLNNRSEDYLHAGDRKMIADALPKTKGAARRSQRSAKHVFKRGFDAYACLGDHISLDVGKMTIVAKLVFDSDSTPDDVEGFDPVEVKRWQEDQWFYAGVCMSVWVGDQLIADDVASLWGVEINISENNDHATQVALDMVPAAITVGRLKLNSLIETLKGALAA